jgi:23S rRNA pseudouridine1911/1915/1917 synthase
MNLPILFEDDAILAVNKPPGVVVNKAESVQGETVQDWVEKTYHIFIENRAGIVHRIDKETSGILLIAKTPSAFIELQRQFKERVIHKTYLAIVHGALVPDAGEIRAPVGRLPWNRERFGIVPGGKEAMTRYRVLSVISDQLSDNRKPITDNFSLVELYPETGRTHQIRVHLKYINHPLVGDYLYAGRKTARDDRTWAKRCMLHAWKLTCIHPVTGETLAIEAPIPDDMSEIIHGRT